MGSILEALLTFVGVILILALAAQGLQELMKAGFGLKGFTRLAALQGLVGEAVAAKGLSSETAVDIVDNVMERLRGLGQKGVRSKAVRLDHVKPDDLVDLIKLVPPSEITGLKTMSDEKGRQYLDCIAAQTKRWFPLAMEPVAPRHTRRMRGLSLLSGFIVVVSLNANAVQIFHLSQTDAEFRTTITAAVVNLNSLDSTAQQLQTELQIAAADTPSPPDTAAQNARLDSLQSIRDSIETSVESVTSGFLAGRMGPWQWTEPTWWLGIMLSTLLVGMGAPFWHDLLGSVLGIRKQLGRASEAKSSDGQAQA